VVSAGGPNSGIFQMLVPAILSGSYEGLRFGLDLARKDVRYYTHMTESLNLPSISAKRCTSLRAGLGARYGGESSAPS
jgi:3-hydroxyisobutyrate dehydrogenase-like beta-hydroxyacid dehydrogenase